MSSATHRAIEAAWRIEAARVVPHAARLVRDMGVAEELAQDALVAALEHLGKTGVPDNPGAWLMATVKNRALDRLRQDALHQRKHEELGHDLDARVALTLRLLGGLTTDEIARAFLLPAATIAQRVVRAKRTLAVCE